MVFVKILFHSFFSLCPILYSFSSAQEDSKADIHSLIWNKPVPLWSKCRFLILAKIGLFLRPFFIYNRKLSANRYYHFKRRIHMQNYLIVFLISMVPLIELRGAIPYAVGFGIPLSQAYIIAIIGNMIPVPFIYLFARKILVWGKDKPVIGKFFTFCLEKGEKGGKKLQATAGKGLFVALMLFVGIPLPGTGAWTGTLAASLLDMDFKSSVLAVLLGVLLAGIIMGAASAGLFGAIGAVVG